MLKFRSIKEKSSLIQIFEYHRIGFLYEYSCKWSLCSHISFFVYQLYKWKFIISSHVRIIFTKCRRNMNDSGTVCQCYIIVTCHIKCFLMLLFCTVSCTLIQWLILFVFQIFSYISLQNLISRCSFFSQFSKNCIQKSLCHVIYISICCFYFYISLARIYTKCKVGRQCPWCCCPCQNIRVFSFYFKSYNCRTLFYILVSLSHFLCRQRSSTTRAVWYDLKSFIQKFFIPDLF